VPVLDPSTPLVLPVASLAGALIGFASGLVPGLHMNNVAAVIVAYPAQAVALCSALSAFVNSDDTSLLVSAMIVSAVVGHLFAEAVTSTYVGIPDGDAVSVLPAHRLAMAGLGSLSVRSSAHGTLVGVVVGSFILVPLCLLMGEPVRLYEFLASSMGFVVLGFSALLVCSSGTHLRTAAVAPLVALRSVALSCALFLAAGLLGLLVFDTNYYACPLPDLQWRQASPVPPSSLLLPLFAGMFGIPGLVLSLSSGAERAVSAQLGSQAIAGPSAKDLLAGVLGGFMVGWLPGMTSGSSAAVCSTLRRVSMESTTVEGASRFVWLYSAVSSVGAVFAMGAFFVLGRTRSGSMDAVASFMHAPAQLPPLRDYVEPMVALVVSALVAALLAYHLLMLLDQRLASVQHVVRSRTVSLGSMAFVCMLAAVLTGTRGLLLMAAASALGLLVPLVGSRRILLMGSLLVPITVGFFT